jgi:hypothetical protein
MTRLLHLSVSIFEQESSHRASKEPVGQEGGEKRWNKSEQGIEAPEKRCMGQSLELYCKIEPVEIRGSGNCGAFSPNLYVYSSLFPPA